MSENAFAGDLLSGLASNPELLKNAMQMASALASSGMLNGLFGGNQPPEQTAQAAPSEPASAPPSSGGFADILTGLLGQNPSGKAAETPRSDAPTEKSSQEAVAVSAGEHKRGPSPGHHERIHLLQSICPFLPEEKREKVQFLIKLLGLLNAAEQMGLGKLF